MALNARLREVEAELQHKEKEVMDLKKEVNAHSEAVDRAKAEGRGNVQKVIDAERKRCTARKENALAEKKQLAGAQARELANLEIMSAREMANADKLI